MNQKVLIAYYSRSGNTLKVANLIHEAVGGILHEIVPENPYPDYYNAVVKQAKREIERDFHPPLKLRLDQVASDETLFIGTPNWWSTIAPPVAAFLSMVDVSRKTILPFCTHGGGGLGQIERDIARLCPQSTVQSSLAIYGSGGMNLKSEVSSWLRKVMASS